MAKGGPSDWAEFVWAGVFIAGLSVILTIMLGGPEFAGESSGSLGMLANFGIPIGAVFIVIGFIKNVRGRRR